MKKSTDVIEIYDNDYFMNQVDGCEEFHDFDGSFRSLFPRYKRNIKLLDLNSHHDFLEIGCGRGEICIYHDLNGGKAKGVDYSEDAIKLAQQKSKDLKSNAEFLVASFDKINDHNNTYDRILASEFIEHISKEESEIFFKIAYNLLKPHGKILVYTMPNTLYRRYGYPIYRFVSLFKFKVLPKIMDDMTSDHYKFYHLNEQNYFSLVSLAKNAGFKKFKVSYDVEPLSPDNNFNWKKTIKSLILFTPLRHILLGNLYLIAKK